LNFLLSLNKTFFLIISVVIFLIILFFVSIVYFKSQSITTSTVILDKQDADITKPKFVINSLTQKISVTANKGNFITDNEIMLQENVVFKSNKFKILSENVTFNKKNLVASSNDKSKFISNNASIDSIGFDIIENGSIINFKGKTKLVLKW